MEGTNKPKENTETYLIRSDTHKNLSQSEGNKCMRTHSKVAPRDSFEEEQPGLGTG